MKIGYRSNVPAPLSNPETEKFWQATKDRRFLLPFCSNCGEAHWYPRAICPFCSGNNIDCRESSGKGIIYSFSLMRQVAEPYIIAYVQLNEGPIILTNIVECDPSELVVGQRVDLSFQVTEGDGPPLVVFRPAA